MKVLITTELYKGTVNGVVTSIKNLEAELRAQGHEVRIMSVSDRHESYREGYVYYMKSIPSKIYPNIRFSFCRGGEYIDELIEWKPDVIHSQCEFSSLRFARIIQKATDCALVHTYHTLYKQYAEYLVVGKNISRAVFKYWIRARLYDVDVVIVPTQKVKNALLEYDVNNPIHIVPTGISLEKYRKVFSRRQIATAKKKLGIAGENKVILVLGRLGYEKNIIEILQGVAEILRTKDDAVLMIVGDGPAKTALEVAAIEMGIAKKVVFTGMIDPNDVTLYYKMADVFISASTSETQGLTYIEALACGLPLVCKKDPCLEGIIQEGKNGYIFEAEEDIHDSILKVLYGTGDFSFAKKNSISVAEKFTTAKFGKNIIGVYENAIFRKEATKDENSEMFKNQKIDIERALRLQAESRCRIDAECITNIHEYYTGAQSNRGSANDYLQTKMEEGKGSKVGVTQKSFLKLKAQGIVFGRNGDSPKMPS